ncbi:toll/interleukin-1 receptor domain-containing protein [Dysgonomonas sp. ZJ279]|uniref:toll/interleukin-1 receptor domain-containing protein n=1 Tax=Dysgonomonas sp. ZJ279 TaxID=2709796 RepID=UPI0013E9D5EA|nr:toll/interleukin-1 receptor domain-containing protein [Dysgonomonas sp. ZJ279]
MNKKITTQLDKCIEIGNSIGQSLPNYISTGQCNRECKGKNSFITELNSLIGLLNSSRPHYSKQLQRRLSQINLPNSHCVERFSFDVLMSLLEMLVDEANNERSNKKIFISHSSEDTIIISNFQKEILMLGCGIKETDIFCTLNKSAIQTGEDFRNEIIRNMKDCDYILLMISKNYQESEVCINEMGAAWALDNKRVLPFVFPDIAFNQMGFMCNVKQGAKINEREKLDEFYQEVIDFYKLTPNWQNFNKRTTDFISLLK